MWYFAWVLGLGFCRHAGGAERHVAGTHVSAAVRETRLRRHAHHQPARHPQPAILGEEGDGELFAAAAPRSTPTASCAAPSSPARARRSRPAATSRRCARRAASSPVRRKTSAKATETTSTRSCAALWGLEVPLIAAVNGPAIGLGNDVACLADIRIAADTRCSAPRFSRSGWCRATAAPGFCRASSACARRRTVLHRRDDRRGTALQWGWCPRWCRPKADGRGARAGREDLPPAAGRLRMTKKLMREALSADFETIMELSAAFQALAHASEDHAEALAAFFEKREPDFKGR
jgi:enoyl-CoA hydratase/carnithine racemase